VGAPRQASRLCHLSVSPVENEVLFCTRRRWAAWSVTVVEEGRRAPLLALRLSYAPFCVVEVRG